jgi:hypothetical protein
MKNGFECRQFFPRPILLLFVLWMAASFPVSRMHKVIKLYGAPSVRRQFIKKQLRLLYRNKFNV